MSFTCSICQEPSKFLWRCQKHCRCDNCGTTEDLLHGVRTVLCHTCDKTRIQQNIDSFDGDTSYTDEITCPHCGCKFSDSWECDDGEHECGDCERTFDVVRNVEVTYSTFKTESE